MSLQEKALTYRGDIRAIAGGDKTLAWVTQHPQKVPTAVYRLAVESLEMTESALPCGGISIRTDKDGFWIGGDDSKLYHLTAKAKTPKAVVELPASAAKVRRVSRNQICCSVASRMRRCSPCTPAKRIQG